VWDLFAEVCRRHGVFLTRRDIDHGRMLADRTHRSIDFQTEERMDTFWREWFRLILQNLGVDRAGEIAGEIRSVMKRESKLHLFDEVEDVLSSISRMGLVLGVVSNYNCLLEPSLRDLGVDGYFDFILASDLIGSGKPDRLIFDMAVDESGVDREACLHVGDSPGADWEGARGAGLRALLLDRSGSLGTTESTVRDLRAVPEYVRRAR